MMRGPSPASCWACFGRVEITWGLARHALEQGRGPGMRCAWDVVRRHFRVVRPASDPSFGPAPASSSLAFMLEACLLVYIIGVVHHGPASMRTALSLSLRAPPRLSVGGISSIRVYASHFAIERVLARGHRLLAKSGSSPHHKCLKFGRQIHMRVRGLCRNDCASAPAACPRSNGRSSAP
jgi:hypothetical protein